MKNLFPFLLVVALVGCQDGDPIEPTAAETAATEPSTRGDMSQSLASFKLWHQGFEQGTESWITDDVPGPPGWCGDIETVQEGLPGASSGRTHAVVRNGECNPYWQDNGFSESGPYSAGAGYSTAWPQGGYVTELDVYLNPNWTASQVFTLALSINLLDHPFPTGFRYFMVPVTVTGGQLQVAGHSVDEAGWYTFRYSADSESGRLSLDFELARHGQPLFDMPLTTTAISGEPTASFSASNVGSGYLWFAGIAPGLGVNIDEHQVRRGK